MYRGKRGDEGSQENDNDGTTRPLGVKSNSQAVQSKSLLMKYVVMSLAVLLSLHGWWRLLPMSPTSSLDSGEPIFVSSEETSSSHDTDIDLSVSAPVKETSSSQDDNSDESVTIPVARDDEEEIVKPIMFVHFHKAGGSSVCRIMRTMQDMVNITDRLGNINRNTKERNCNTDVSGPMRSAAIYANAQTCYFHQVYTTDRNGIPFRRNNFLAVEVPLQDTMPCEGFRSLAIIRRPVERVLSHMQFDGYREYIVTQWIDNRTRNSPHSYMDGYPIVNNMMIRQLLGRDRYTDVHPIDHNDLEQAKALVDEFDAFVPLEHLLHPNVLRLLKETIPEYYQGLQQAGNIVANKAKIKRPQPSDEFLERLLEENMFDEELYEHVLEKLKIKSTEY